MSAVRPIRVMLTDDHLIVRQSLRELLKTAGHFKVVGEAQNGREAVPMAALVRPDVILMDISMPVLNGLDATQQILAKNPAAKVIILSAYDDAEYVERASAVGAAGFLAKQNFADTLAQAIRDVVNGCAFFSPATLKRSTRTGGKPRACRPRAKAKDLPGAAESSVRLKVV